MSTASTARAIGIGLTTWSLLSGCGGGRSVQATDAPAAIPAATPVDPRMTGDPQEDPLPVGEGQRVDNAELQVQYGAVCLTWQKLKASSSRHDANSLELILKMGLDHRGMRVAAESVVKTVQAGHAISAKQSTTMDWLCSKVAPQPT